MRWGVSHIWRVNKLKSWCRSWGVHGVQAHPDRFDLSKYWSDHKILGEEASTSFNNILYLLYCGRYTEARKLYFVCNECTNRRLICHRKYKSFALVLSLNSKHFFL